ncbi:MAG: pentapeptide repeat-containing protein [Campylobacterales bacterium]|nr:pentapeptide repeat-containing protein [Campylobacterales bacterium]
MTQKLIISTSLITSLLLLGCGSSDKESQVAFSDLENAIVSEEAFNQNPALVANSDKTVFLQVEHPQMKNEYMSPHDILDKGCDTITYNIAQDNQVISLDADMNLNISIYKNNFEVTHLTQGQSINLGAKGNYKFKICHNGTGYKDMNIPVFIGSAANTTQTTSYQTSTLTAANVNASGVISIGRTVCNNENITISNLNFTRSDLAGVEWTGCTINNSIFDHTNFDAKTTFQNVNFTNNTFKTVTFFPQTLHGAPTFTGNHVQNSVFLAPSFVYKKDASDAGITDLTNTSFVNTKFYAPIFGALIYNEYYKKAPWYDILYHGLEDVWHDAGTAKFWERVGEVTGIAVAMAGLSIISGGTADVAAAPGLADYLADGAEDLGTDIADETTSEEAEAAAEEAAQAAADDNVAKASSAAFDTLSTFDKIEDLDTITESELDDTWVEVDEQTQVKEIDFDDPNEICKSPFYNKPLVHTNTLLAGVKLGVSYLQHLQNGDTNSSGFFQKDVLIKSVGAVGGMAVDKYMCDNTERLANRNLLLSGEVDTKTILKQIGKSVVISLGVDAAAAFKKDVADTDEKDTQLINTFTGLKNSSRDIAAITSAYANLLVDNNTSNFFQNIKRYHFASQALNTTLDSNETNTSAPQKLQAMTLKMQEHILQNFTNINGAHPTNEVLASTTKGVYNAKMQGVTFTNCLVSAPKFGDTNSSDYIFGDMNNTIIISANDTHLPIALFNANQFSFDNMALFGGNYDLYSLYSNQPKLHANNIILYDVNLTNLDSLSLTNATLVNTHITLSSAKDVTLTNSSLSNYSSINVTQGNAQNIDFTDSVLMQSTLNLAQNTKLNMTRAKIQNLNENNTTTPSTYSPVGSGTQDWSFSSLTCQDIMNTGSLTDFFTDITSANLQGVHFTYSPTCNLTGLLALLENNTIDDTSYYLTMDANITGTSEFTVSDMFKYHVWMPGKNYSNVDVVSESIVNLDLSHINFSNMEFTDVNISNVDFNGSSFSNVSFNNSDMRNLNFANTHFSKVHFETSVFYSDFTNAVFYDASIEDSAVYSEVNYEQIPNYTIGFSNWKDVQGLDLCNLFNKKLLGRDVKGADLSNCTLDVNNYFAYSFVDSNFSNSTFSDLFLLSSGSGSDFSGSKFSFGTSGTTPVSFTFIDMSNASFKGTYIGGSAQLGNSNFTNVDFSGAVVPDSYFDGSNLTGANFSGATLSGSDFSGANLTDANLDGANITNITIDSSTTLTNIDWKGINSSWLCTQLKSNPTQFGHSLRNANLSGCDLRNFDFSSGNLSGTNFSGATLIDADFSNAQLEDTNFSNAFLTFTKFDSVVLTNADFTGADISATSFDNLAADALKNVIWRDTTGFCNVFGIHAYNSDVFGNSMIGADLLGCDQSALQQFPFNGMNLNYARLPNLAYGIILSNSTIEGADLSGISNLTYYQLPWSNNSFKDVKWPRVDFCTQVVTSYSYFANHTESFGNTLINADLKNCDAESADVDFVDWNLTSTILPLGYAGELSCSDVSNATIFLPGSQEQTFADGTYCDGYSYNGTCNQTESPCY